MSRRNRKKSDSHPVNFSTIDLRDLTSMGDRLLSNNNSLDFLTVEVVRECIHEATRGAYAQIQWLWEQLEPSDPILATCVDRRSSALAKIPWSVAKLDDLSDLEDMIAEAQLRTIQDFCNAVAGLDEAIAAFGQASFRAFRRVQMLESSSGLELVVTNNWNWARVGYQGEWRWNPHATFGSYLAEEVPVPEDTILTRCSPRPIDQPGMMLALDRKNAKAQWMTFNGRYGVPPLFIVLPPGTNDQTKRDYIEFARQCISNAGGVLPPGADLKTASAQGSGPDTFRGIIDLSTQELVLRATGGMTTMLTAPGEGTNTGTGNAHQDAFDDLADAEGAEIAALLTRDMIGPVLDQWHPGQPRLVEFVIKRPEAEDTAASVANIATLAGAGYRAPDEQVTELTGLDVTTTQQPAMGMMQPPGNPAATTLQDLHTRYAPTMLWPPAREVFDARVRRDLNSLTQLSAPDRQPAAHDFLSQTALQHRAAAYEKILMEAVLAGRAQGAAEVAETTPKTDENEKSPETALERADTPEPPNHPQNENKRFCNSFATGLRADFENASESDDENEDEEVYFEEEDEDDYDFDAPGDDDDENGMSRREAAKHAADVRWGNAVPKGTTREGESSKYKKSGSPYARKPSAKKREQIQAVKRAIEKSQSDKTTLYDVCRIKEYPVDIPYGTPGEKEKGHYSGYGNGVSHMFANHIRPNDTTVEKAAQTIILGRKRRVGKDKIVSEFGEHVAVLGIRQGRLKLITCYRDTTGRKRKHPGQEPGSTDRNTESTAPYYADAAPLVVSDRQASVARPDVQANTTDGTINTNFQENDTTLQ